jgi:hypothetical protein
VTTHEVADCARAAWEIGVEGWCFGAANGALSARVLRYFCLALLFDGDYFRVTAAKRLQIFIKTKFRVIYIATWEL